MRLCVTGNLQFLKHYLIADWCKPLGGSFHCI